MTIDQEDFLESFYPSADNYNTLYEVDDYAWYHGGRNLYDAQTFTVGTSRNYTIAANANTLSGRVTVALSAYTTGSNNNATADMPCVPLRRHLMLT